MGTVWMIAAGVVVLAGALVVQSLTDSDVASVVAVAAVAVVLVLRYEVFGRPR